MNISELIQRSRKLHAEYIECIEQIQRAIDQTAISPIQCNPVIEVIQHTVADHFTIPHGAMRSKIRTNAWAKPRQIAMYLTRKLTSYTSQEIGRAFGARVHHTVTKGAQIVLASCSVNAVFKAEVDALEKIAADRLHEFRKTSKTAI